MFADVIVRQRTGVETLTYAVPAAIIPYIRVGAVVGVPLRRRSVSGVVVVLKRRVPSELRGKLKDITTIDRSAAGFSPSQIQVIERLADYYGASLAEVAYHALAQPTVDLKSRTKAEQKPIFIQAPWPDRLKLYRKLVDTHRGQRLVFLFPLEAFGQLFAESLGDSSGLFTFPLAATQRRRLDTQLTEQKPYIIIGGQGQTFFPLQPGDVLVMDQPEHIGFESRRRPYLKAKRVALIRAQTEGIQVIFGADLPSADDVVAFDRTQLRLRAKKLPTRSLTILSQQRANILLLPSFEQELVVAAQAGQKILLLTASRGWASALFCRECQEVVSCPKCGRPIGLRNAQELHCRYCGHTYARPFICAHCRGELISLGAGVSQISHTVRSLLPTRKISEVSSDTDEAPIHAVTVATEKILSFPAVYFDVVLMLGVDRMLTGVDPNGAWQLLAALLALDSRSDRTVIQTHFPDHWVWSAAATGQFRPYFAKELAERKKYQLPPFGQEIGLLGVDPSPTRLHQQAVAVSQKVRAAFDSAALSEPFWESRSGQRAIRLTLYRAKFFSAEEKRQLRGLLPLSWSLLVD